MKRIKLVLIIVSVFIASLVFAQPILKPQAIETYQKVWNETNSDVRLKLIKSIWLKESAYEDPAATIKGVEAFNAMVSNFYKDFPGALFESDVILTKGNYCTWTWRIFDAKHNLMIAGRDVATLDAKGHILKLVGFWEPKGELDENSKIVAKYFECLFKTGDFGIMASLISAGATYYQAEGLPYGGTYIGFEDWTKMFIKARGFFDLQIEKEPSYFSDETKGGVIIRFTIKCTSKKSGKIISMPISEHFEVRQGKITSIRPFYFDTKAFAEFLN